MKKGLGRFSWIALAFVAALAACNKGGEAGGAANDTTTGTASGGTANSAAPTVDNGLKHDGFRYMGFGRTDEMTYEYSKLEGTPGLPGTEAIEVLESSPEKAMIKVNRSGSLSDLGSETYEVRGDGVYLTVMELGPLTEPMLAIPADVKVGSKWTSKLVTEGTGTGKYEFTINNVAEKEEELTVKGGKFPTLLVSGKGTMTSGGKSQTINYKTWYSKDVGTVMMRIEVLDAGKSMKSSVELTKIGK